MNKYVFKGPFRITGCYLQDWGHWEPPAKPHRGLDLVGDDDITVYSPCCGKVEHAGDGGDGFGIYVKILNVDGNHHYLCHLKETFLRQGQKVNYGDKLGVMGATGNVTGAHTHYEIRDKNGNIHSPADYLGLPNKQGTYNLTIQAAAAKVVPIIHIDTPKAGAVITSDCRVTGWTIGPDGMQRADFYLDDKIWLGSTNALCGRTDVGRLYDKGYKNPDVSGIVYTMPYATLPKGKHTLCIAGVPAKGVAVWVKIPIEVK